MKINLWIYSTKDHFYSGDQFEDFINSNFEYMRNRIEISSLEKAYDNLSGSSKDCFLSNQFDNTLTINYDLFQMLLRGDCIKPTCLTAKIETPLAIDLQRFAHEVGDLSFIVSQKVYKSINECNLILEAVHDDYSLIDSLT